MGTTYDVNHMDAEYARIDGGPQNPGYLSEKLDYIIGDVSGDGRLTISDVTLLIDLLLYGDMNGNAAADVNRDGIVNLSDLTALIDLLQGIN